MSGNSDILAGRSRKVCGDACCDNPGRRSQTRYARGYKYFTPNGVSKWPAVVAHPRADAHGLGWVACWDAAASSPLNSPIKALKVVATA